MSPYNRKQTYDPNIISSLEKLPKTMMNNEKKEVKIRLSARNESGAEHIAVVTHGLQIRDIKLIPKVLRNPEHFCVDPNNKNYKNYYRKREGKHDSKTRNKGIYLKIVTSVKLDGREEIVTVYPTNSIKDLKTKKS